MIAHIDVDAFFASVLVRKDPRLKGKPLLALGMGGGCVIAASYEAKAYGITTGMRLVEAKRLCPHAIERLSDFAEACRASRDIEDILANHCPRIERMSVDEWFLDLRSLVGGTPKDTVQWAQDVQTVVRQHLALSVSIGIGPTKTLAKMASEYRKPAGITVLTLENQMSNHSAFCILHSSFLHDRPAAAIPGIGHARTKHTEAHGWKTAWDFAHAPADTAARLFGKAGRELQQELHGVSVYPLQVDDRPPKSVSRCRSFRMTRHADVAYAYLLEHVSILVRKMRREDLACRSIAVWIRNREYRASEARRRLPQPTDTEEALLIHVRECFYQLWESQGHATQAGLALHELTPRGSCQYSLFEAPKRTDGRESIQCALDAVHARFGRNAVVRGRQVPIQPACQRVSTAYGDVTGSPVPACPRKASPALCTPGHHDT
ncbi:DNA polymerase IV [Candidatus Peribacteria bacterium]|nr:DNA polymerase IV [Candidatus Peribacteria bacterium]